MFVLIKGFANFLKVWFSLNFMMWVFIAWIMLSYSKKLTFTSVYISQNLSQLRKVPSSSMIPLMYLILLSSSCLLKKISLRNGSKSYKIKVSLQ